MFKKGNLIFLQDQMDDDENFNQEVLGILDVHK